MNRMMRAITKENLLLIFILTAGFFIRLYRLDFMPLHYDEFWDTIQGNEMILSGQAEKLFGFPMTLYSGRFFILYNSLSLFTGLFTHDPVFIARIPAVVAGTLTVWTTYLLGSQLYNRKTGLIAAAFLAFLPWHIVMSRIGLKIILGPLGMTLALYWLVRAFQSQKALLFAAAFFMAAATSFYTYQSFMIALPVFFVAYLLFRRNFQAPSQNILLAALLLFLIVFIPVFFLNQSYNLFVSPTAFFFHDQIPFDAPRFLKLFFQNGISSFFIHFTKLFIYAEHPMSVYAPSLGGPLFVTPFLGLMILAGLVYALFKRTLPDLVLLFWFFIVLFLSSFTLKIFDQTYSARYIFAILPAPLLLAARIIASSAKPLEASRPIFKNIFGRISVVVILAMELFTFVGYFKGADQSFLERRAYSAGCREAASYLYTENQNNNYGVIIDHAMTVEPYLDYYSSKSSRGNAAYWTLNFSSPSLEPVISEQTFFEIERKKNEDNREIYFILWSPETHRMEDNLMWGGKLQTQFYRSFKEKYPGLAPIKKIPYPDGKISIEIFRISPSAVSRMDAGLK